MKYLLLLMIPLFLSATPRTIHTVVALCDNDHQGIVPVPKTLGNGQKPRTNLYWGARYGLKTHLLKSKKWRLIKTIKNPEKYILERAVLRHKKSGTYLIADGYDGRYIKKTIAHFLNFTAGHNRETITIKNQKLPIRSSADLVIYIGHNGLMDFSLPAPKKKGQLSKEVMILACASKPYFKPFLKQLNARPLLWTTHLLAPEGYIIEAALESWIKNQGGKSIHKAAAKAYNKYQKCGMRGAKRLFATGY